MKKRILYLLLLPILVACGDEPQQETVIEPTAPPPVAAADSPPPPPPAPPPPVPQTPVVIVPEVTVGGTAGELGGTGQETRPQASDQETMKMAQSEGKNGKASTSSGAGAGKDGMYVIKPGDTLIEIGREYDINYWDIAKWNDIIDPHSLRVGQELRLSPPPPRERGDIP